MTVRVLCCLLLFGVCVAAGNAAEQERSKGAAPLQGLIDAATPGAVIDLSGDDHEGPVTIDKPLTLRHGRIIGPGKGSVITVAASGVILRDLTIESSGLSLEHMDSAIKITKDGDGALIDGNRLIGNLIGVHLEGPDDARVRDNVIEGRTDLRMNERGNGVYVWNSPGSIVEGNTIRFGRDGIFSNTSENNIFRDNQFDDLRFAIHYMYTNHSEISGNVSRGNHIGYAIMYSTDVDAHDNKSIGDRDYGIMLNYANESSIERNRITGTEDKCVFIYNSNKNRFEGNRFEGCGIGVHFTAGSERNAMTGNAFIGNQTQVKYVGSRWLEWSEDGRGNYWSDNTAFDLDGDGLADSAYRPNDLVDHIVWRQPMAKLLLTSPAVQLLHWTQSQFPALLPGGIVDTAPLMLPVGGDGDDHD